MRAGYVDRMLARIDGAVAPIWVTHIIYCNPLPAELELQAALSLLVQRIPRLQLRWSKGRDDWQPDERNAAQVAAAVRVQGLRPGEALGTAIGGVLKGGVDLGGELLLRITLIRESDDPSPHGAIVVQLHHAIGDARALMFLTSQLWQIVAEQRSTEVKLPLPTRQVAPDASPDHRMLSAAVRHWPALRHLTNSSTRLLVRRATALAASSRPIKQVGAPELRSLAIDVAPLSSGDRSALFFAALLAGAVDWGLVRRDLPIRLRVPVDLRRQIGIDTAVANVVSAIPVEFGFAEVRCLLGDPGTLIKFVSDRMAMLLQAGVQWATLLEMMAASRVATAKSLRKHTAPELIADVRGSTLVTTYLGSLDRYVAQLPAQITAMQGHTPTWGSVGFCFRDKLVINLHCFSGIWDMTELAAFANCVAAWLRSAGFVVEAAV